MNALPNALPCLAHLHNAKAAILAGDDSNEPRKNKLLEALSEVTFARDKCPSPTVLPFLDSAWSHLQFLVVRKHLSGLHEVCALSQLDRATFCLRENGVRRSTPLPTPAVKAARELIAALPTNDEAPARPIIFIQKVIAARWHPDRREALVEVYRLAAEGGWGRTLADINMLVFSLEHNRALALEVIQTGNMAAILARLSRDTAMSYWEWLWWKLQ